MNEARCFIPSEVIDQESFNKYLAVFLPGEALEPQRALIREEYDCQVRFNGSFADCVGAIIEHLVFTCNTRYLADAFLDKTYAMQYGFPANSTALHGVDLIPLFTSTFEEAKAFLIELGFNEWLAEQYAELLIKTVAPVYPKFFASFGISGDPNTLLESPPLTWSHVDGSDDILSGVVTVQGGDSTDDAFIHASDERNTRSICSFWQRIAGSIAEDFGNKGREEL